MKPIKLKELLRTAKDPATQKIAIAENYTLYVVPLFEGLVKDVDETLGERILSDWRVETDSTRFIAFPYRRHKQTVGTPRSSVRAYVLHQ